MDQRRELYRAAGAADASAYHRPNPKPYFCIWNCSLYSDSFDLN